MHAARHRYEHQFADMIGAAAAWAFARGRHGLAAMLRALGIGQGDLVGVCGYTCYNVVEAVRACGAGCIYLDVDAHLCVDPAEVLKQPQGSLKAVILQHTFGVPGQLDSLLEACRTIGAAVIEDCAQAVGSFWKGQMLGQFGRGAIYSFQWGKPISTGQGGMLTANDSAIISAVEAALGQYAGPMSSWEDIRLATGRIAVAVCVSLGIYERVMWSFRRLRGAASGTSHELPDCRLDEGYVRLAGPFLSRAGLRKLRQWPQIQQLRRANVEMIKDRFRTAGLPLWPVPAEADVTMLRYPFLSANKAAVLAEARLANLDIAGWYDTPVHPLVGKSLEEVGYRPDACPSSRRMVSQVLHIPTGTTMSKKTLEKMIAVLLRSR